MGVMYVTVVHGEAVPVDSKAHAISLANLLVKKDKSDDMALVTKVTHGPDGELKARDVVYGIWWEGDRFEKGSRTETSTNDAMIRVQAARFDVGGDALDTPAQERERTAREAREREEARKDRERRTRGW